MEGSRWILVFFFWVFFSISADEIESEPFPPSLIGGFPTAGLWLARFLLIQSKPKRPRVPTSLIATQLSLSLSLSHHSSFFFNAIISLPNNNNNKHNPVASGTSDRLWLYLLLTFFFYFLRERVIKERSIVDWKETPPAVMIFSSSFFFNHEKDFAASSIHSEHFFFILGSYFLLSIFFFGFQWWKGASSVRLFPSGHRVITTGFFVASRNEVYWFTFSLKERKTKKKKKEHQRAVIFLFPPRLGVGTGDRGNFWNPKEINQLWNEIISIIKFFCRKK